MSSSPLHIQMLVDYVTGFLGGPKVTSVTLITLKMITLKTLVALVPHIPVITLFILMFLIPMMVWPLACFLVSYVHMFYTQTKCRTLICVQA